MSDIRVTDGGQSDGFAVSRACLSGNEEFCPNPVFKGEGEQCVKELVNSGEDTDSEPSKLEQAYLEGYRDGKQEGLDQQQLNSDARERLASALGNLDRTNATRLSEALWSSLKHLILAAIGKESADEKLLKTRCEEAVQLISGEIDEATLFVSPQDFQVIEQSEQTIKIEEDCSLLPGSVRIRHPGGEITCGSSALLEQIDGKIDSSGMANAAI